MTKQITAPELKKIIQEGKDVILIDTRTPKEHAAGHIPNSVLIPYDQIARRWQEIGADKDALIVVYCRSGNRSMVAAAILEKAGFTNIHNLEGGIVKW